MSDNTIHPTIEHALKTGGDRFSAEMNSIDIDVGLLFKTEEGKNDFIEKLKSIPINTPIHLFAQVVPRGEDNRAIKQPVPMPCSLDTEASGPIMESMTDVEQMIRWMNTAPQIIVRLEYNTYKQDMIEGDFLRKGEDYDIPQDCTS